MWRVSLQRFAASCVTILLFLNSSPLAASITTVSDGHVVLNGNPFFPIGMYHVSWIADREHEGLEADLREIAAAGFNVIHPTLQDQHGPLLRIAAELGIYTIGELYPPRAAEIIDQLEDYDAVLGWNVADDFNWPPGAVQNQTPQEVAARTALFKQTDPAHLAYGSGGGFPGLRHTDYIDSMDLMGIQSYPVGDVSDAQALRENWDYFETLYNRVTREGGTYIANLQSFSWRGGRYPTPEEARNMLFAALLNGAKGILWYTFYDDSGFLPENAPALWNELKREVRELSDLSPFFLSGRLTRLTADNDLFAGYFEHAGEILLLALNTDRASAHTMSVTLPGGLGEVSHTLAPGGTYLERIGAAIPETCSACGDIDGDGNATLTDALVLLQHLINLPTPGTCFSAD